VLCIFNQETEAATE